MRGVDVKVRAPVSGEADALGNPKKSWSEPSTVHDVLAYQGSTSDSVESNRPDGETVAYTLSFPSSFTQSLRGCEVQVQGDQAWYRVSGDPKPMPAGQTRRALRWNRTVEAVRDDG